MRLDQGEKVTAVYLWSDKDGRWPDVVMLRSSGDVDMSQPATRQVGYVRADEAKADSDRLEKTILALVDYVERDGEMLRDTAPHFAEMLVGMGLYRDDEMEVH